MSNRAWLLTLLVSISFYYYLSFLNLSFLLSQHYMK
nr:MAG TPA: hypothetical protein [Caudoviricetes sp.]